MATNPFPTPFPAVTAQLAYANSPSNPKPGTLGDTGVKRVSTAINATVLGIFGTIVVNDPAVVQGWKYATSQADVNKGVLGMLVRTSAIESRRDTAPPSYDAGVPANVLEFGNAWTASEVAVLKHDPVYVRVVANGALNTLGALRNDADGGNAILVTGARWMDDAAENVANRVELNFIGA